MDAATFRAGELPLRSLGTIVDADDGRVIPAAVLDSAGRPDVADLIRVHASEGIGDLRCGVGLWDVGDPSGWLLRLEVTVDHPVACRFHVVLGWSASRAWLEAVANAGAVALATGDSEGRWLMLNVDPKRLGSLLG